MIVILIESQSRKERKSIMDWTKDKGTFKALAEEERWLNRTESCLCDLSPIKQCLDEIESRKLH